jgi:uncharacterized protein (DUF488 family)
MTPLRTIGYEGFKADDWLRELCEQGVEVVVDVRDLPLSRRGGFSKTALRDALAERGVAYIHVRAFGNPKELRDALKTGLPFEEFAHVFAGLLDARGQELADLAALAGEKATCLVCFEEDPTRCHRSLVAERVAQVSGGAIRVEHLRNAC